MAAFRRLVFAALCAGLLAGVFAAAAHQLGTVPLILEAESYEQQATQAAAQGHSHAAVHHEDAGEGWTPADGIERSLYTLAADLLAAIGFALLLAAGLSLRGGAVTWRDGLFWGLAGFAAFTLAPGLGLPPEIPGSEAAPLFSRQLWWLATAAATGSGLALLAFTRRASLAALAVMLLILPHVIGAPQPAEHASAAPEALARQFVVAVTLVSLVYWAILGASTAYFYRRFGSAKA
jgi:cobalt transporter subunit CbtA